MRKRKKLGKNESGEKDEVRKESVMKRRMRKIIKWEEEKMLRRKWEAIEEKKLRRGKCGEESK